MIARAALPSRITLDTNVVLDWLVFRDRRAHAVAQAIEARQLQWVACAAMRSELERTLAYRSLAAWSPDHVQVLAVFDRHAALLPQPPTLPLMRCSDLDDQVFVDLAAASGSRWLLTHDRALLRLARRARPLGLDIVRPQDWRGPEG